MMSVLYYSRSVIWYVYRILVNVTVQRHLFYIIFNNHNGHVVEILKNHTTTFLTH